MARDADHAEYLRRLIETQPACLLRVRRDGVVLACNEAGLGLLSCGRLADALDKNLADRLEAASRPPWRLFVERVWADGSGSIECQLTQPGDLPRTVQFKGTALRDHPDGMESILLAGRDHTSILRLENALEEIATSQEPNPADLKDRIAELESELAQQTEGTQRLRSTLDELFAREAEATALNEALERRLAALETTLRERPEPALVVDDSLPQQIAALETALADARDGKAHLESLLEATSRDRQQRDVEYLQALSQMKQELDRAQVEILRHNENDAERQRLARQVEELTAARADETCELNLQVEELTYALAEATREQERLVDARAKALEEHDRSALEALAAMEAQLSASHDQNRPDVRAAPLDDDQSANLRQEIAAAVGAAEQARARLARAEADHQRVVVQYAAERTETQHVLGEAILRKNQAVKALADQRIELQQWLEQATALEPLAAAGRLTRDLSRDLQSLLESVEDRARLLLSLTPLEASYRPEIETLRTESLRAASLLRQLSSTDRAGGPSAARAVESDAA